VLSPIPTISPVAPGDSDVLTGSVLMWPMPAAPTGYLLCDGQAVSRATFLDLFTAIGTAYGTGDGSTTFNVPNFKGKAPVGLDAAQTEFDALAEAGGSKTFTPTGTVAAPTFTGTSNIATNGVSAGTPAGTVAAPVFTGSALGTHAHELPFTKTSGGTGALRMLAQSVFGSGASRASESVSAAPTASATANTVALSQAVTAGTPAGTNSAPAFTGSALGTHSHTVTPTGTNSAPIFTGAAGASLSPYLVLNFIIKA
jgi:microcystin-dependent protein